MILFLWSVWGVWAADTEDSGELSFEFDDPGIRLDQLMEMDVPRVYAASKWEQPLSRAPSSVTIITREEIERSGRRSLEDVLRSVRSIHVSHDQIYSYLGIRGVNRGDFNSRSLILINGHRLNNSLSDGSLIGTGFLLDIDLIERVEIVRGAGSTLYGNNAFSGVINIVTRQGNDFIDNGVESAFSYGSFDTWQGRVSYGQLFENGLDLVASASWYESQGNPELRFPGFGFIRDGDGESNHKVFLSATWNTVTLEGGYVDRSKLNPTPLFSIPAFGDIGEQADQRGYASLKLQQSFSQDWSLLARLYFDAYRFDAENYFLAPPIFLNEQRQLGDSVGGEFQVDKSFDDRHIVTFGAEYRNVFNQEFDSVNRLPAGTLVSFDERQSTSNVGMYVQGEYEWNPRLHLNAGIRFDDYRVVKAEWSPRLAIIYGPWDRTTFKAIYGTAFRAPNVFERQFSVPGASLISERIRSWELVYEQQYTGRIRSNVSLFRNAIDDLIGQTTTGLLGFVNTPAAVAQGIELELIGQTGDGVHGSLSYIGQQVEERATGNRLTDSPSHILKLGLTAPVYKDTLFLSGETFYLSSRRTLSGQLVGGYSVSNFSLLARDVFKGADMTLGVYNLFDRLYDDPATPNQELLSSIQQDGRTVYAKLSYRF